MWDQKASFGGFGAQIFTICGRSKCVESWKCPLSVHGSPPGAGILAGGAEGEKAWGGVARWERVSPHGTGHSTWADLAPEWSSEGLGRPG